MLNPRTEGPPDKQIFQVIKYDKKKLPFYEQFHKYIFGVVKMKYENLKLYSTFRISDRP